MQIASVAYGALLWVSCRSADTAGQSVGRMVGMLFGFVTELYIGCLRVPWTWYVAIGTVVTFAVGYGVSLSRTEKLLTAKDAK